MVVTLGHSFVDLHIRSSELSLGLEPPDEIVFIEAIKARKIQQGIDQPAIRILQAQL